MVSGTASAGTDLTPPHLVGQQHLAFNLGEALAFTDDLPSVNYVSASVRFGWKQDDESGICSDNVYGVNKLGETTLTVTLTDPPAAPRFFTYVNSYDGSQGGDTQVATGVRIDANDCAGNTASWFTSSGFAVADDAGAVGGNGSASLQGPVYRGDWTVGTLTVPIEGFLENTAHSSTQRGARAAVAVDVDAGSHLGLVMSESYRAGRVKVLLDGNVVRRIDLAARGNRVSPRVVTDIRLSAGTHRVVLVKASEAGSITLDAVVLTSGAVGGHESGPL
jgi:hypothetical protein